MKCSDFDGLFDDFLDGELPRAQAQEAQAHARKCAHCAAVVLREERLREALRGLPVPPRRPEFVERVLGRTRVHTRAGRVPKAVGFALAASLVLGVGLGAFWTGMYSEREPQVMLTTAGPQPQAVTLLYNAKAPLAGVSLTLRVPPHVALEGYGDRRELVWRTDLEAGRNTLRLPLVVRGTGSGYLETEIAHGENRKTFRVKLVVRSAGDASSRDTTGGEKPINL